MPLLLIAFCSLSATGTANEYVEDFTSRTFCDTLNTTAFWDTAMGKLRLRPFSVSMEGGCLTYDSARDVAVEGVYVLDVANPSTPVLVDSYDTSGYAVAAAPDGEHVLVADHDSGLVALRVRESTRPFLVCSDEGSNEAHCITLSGDYAYVANVINGLVVVDISDPTNPTQVGTCDPAPYVMDVDTSGDFAYLACREDGLHVVDIEDPTNPVALGGVSGLGWAQTVSVIGELAYVACDTSGIKVVDVSDPENPVLLSGHNTPGAGEHIAVEGDYAFVADGAAGVHVFEVYQRQFDARANLAQSLPVGIAGLGVYGARLNTVQADSILWEMSADGGGHWEAITPDGEWVYFLRPGGDLLWRSTHTYLGGHVDPSCTSLTIGTLYECPILTAVSDIPDDQGRQVRLSWARSAYDVTGSIAPILEYSVFRRITETREPQVGLGQDARYPPGDWDYVVSVPAYLEDGYSVVVPTLTDSTSAGGMGYSVFFVRAATATPGLFFDAPPDSGYSVDNLAPSVPTGLGVDYGATENELAWEECEDDDFQYFRIYRSTDPEFTPASENLVHMTVDTGWVDPVSEGWQYYYKVSAVDFSGNESDAASPETVTGVDDSSMPSRYALYQNVPNPLNPTTTISYDVPANGGHVSLDIFDVRGRLVRRLVDGYVEGGRRTAVWDGRDDGGDRVASGVYYYRLSAPGYERMLKMTVLK